MAVRFYGPTTGRSVAIWLARCDVTGLRARGAAVCAVTMLGAAAGSVVIDSALNAYQDEIEEYRSWGVR